MWGALSSCIADTLGCCAFHFSFAVSSTITEKIISQENEKKKKDSQIHPIGPLSRSWMVLPSVLFSLWLPAALGMSMLTQLFRGV